MSIRPLPEAITQAMSSLALTDSDRDNIKQFRTLLELNLGIEHDFTGFVNAFADYFYSNSGKDRGGSDSADRQRVFRNWFTKKVCSLKEASTIFDGTHEFYDFDSSQKQRLGQFLFEIESGYVATGPMCERWDKAIASSRSEEEAIVELWAMELGSA